MHHFLTAHLNKELGTSPTSPPRGGGAGGEGEHGPLRRPHPRRRPPRFHRHGAAAIRALSKAKCILYDVKAVLPVEQVDGRL